MMLAAERSIPHDPSQHAAYVQSWIKALKEDKNEIFRAAADASRACDFLLERERQKPDSVTHADRVTAQAQERRAIHR
jgi:antirestriction protein ArdC